MISYIVRVLGRDFGGGQADTCRQASYEVLLVCSRLQFQKTVMQPCKNCIFP